jgi:hypothetical protein
MTTLGRPSMIDERDLDCPTSSWSFVPKKAYRIQLNMFEEHRDQARKVQLNRKKANGEKRDTSA